MVYQNTHGIGRYVVNLVQGLSLLGQNVSILTNSMQTKEIIGEKFITDVITCKKDFVSPLAPLDLSIALRKKKFDIIHFPSFDLPLVMPENCVVTLHDMTHLHKPAKPRNILYYSSIVRHGLSRAKKVIAVSEWTKNEIHKYLKTPLDKISVVRNGLEEKWFESDQQNKSLYNSKLTLSNSYFLCLSNPKPHKNVITLIRSCQKLWSDGKDFSLVLSLGGEKIPDDWDLTPSQLKKIVLLNQASDQELMTYYKNSVALISPSLLEGYNYPVAEALAVGCPAIVADTSANAEFRGGNIAFYRPAESSDALTKLMIHALDNQHSKNENTNHNVITRQKMAEETLAIYAGNFAI